VHPAFWAYLEMVASDQPELPLGPGGTVLSEDS
jgi:hypothetical protein